jgi:hypothetical protein
MVAEGCIRSLIGAGSAASARVRLALLAGFPYEDARSLGPPVICAQPVSARPGDGIMPA